MKTTTIIIKWILKVKDCVHNHPLKKTFKTTRKSWIFNILTFTDFDSANKIFAQISRKPWVFHIKYYVFINYYFFNPIEDGIFWGWSRMEEWWGRTPISKICDTYLTIMKLGTVIPSLKKTRKIYGSHDTPFEFCWYQHFFIRNQ